MNTNFYLCFFPKENEKLNEKWFGISVYKLFTYLIKKKKDIGDKGIEGNPSSEKTQKSNNKADFYMWEILARWHPEVPKEN